MWRCILISGFQDDGAIPLMSAGRKPRGSRDALGHAPALMPIHAWSRYSVGLVLSKTQYVAISLSLRLHILVLCAMSLVDAFGGKWPAKTV